MRSKLLTIDELYRSGGDWIGQAPTAPIELVTIDSRKCIPNSMFFALKGNNSDGQEFISKALECGASIVVYSDSKYDSLFSKSGKLGIRVPDPILYMHDLAKRVMRKVEYPVLAITGSNGKTTTKEMIASVLANKYTVHKTNKNLNNHLGVPLTIFELEKRHNFFVVEMGMNHAGEIWTLCEIAMPNSGLITNIGTAHIEYFGTQEKIAEAKGELFSYLRKNKGFLFVNADDPFLLKQLKKTTSASFYGIKNGEASVRATHLKADEFSRFSFRWIEEKSQKSGSVKLKLPGIHHVHNALSAVAVGIRHGINPQVISETLSEFYAQEDRMEMKSIGNITIISDCYNANPDSMKAGLKALSDMSKSHRKIAVLGDMFELGELSQNLHKEIGEFINTLHIDGVVTIGKETKQIHKAISESSEVKEKHHFGKKEDANSWLDKNIQQEDILYIKASHGMKLETITQFLENKLK